MKLQSHSLRFHRFISFFSVLCLFLSLQPPLLWDRTQNLFSAGAASPPPASDPLGPLGACPQQADTASLPFDIPVSVSRVQSAYQAAAAVENTVVITFTVTNNQPRMRMPTVSDSATITETLDVLAAFDLADDPNTLHDVALVDVLTADAALSSSSRPPVQNGKTFTWTLGDIPPQESQVLTVALQVPGTTADFIDLDLGATASGRLWGIDVSGTVAPSLLAPDAVGAATLQATVDADMFDADMLWRSAALEQDPLQLFAYVRDLDYDPYVGSLRGTRGTLWGQAGNALDQSSLLIAMLRAAGIPARYRHGTLSAATAQALIAEMFPQAPGIAGHVPDGTEVADPLNDPELIALVSDHWWVEAYLPGSGWTDLDPSFANATPAQVFAESAASDGTDRISEIPDMLRYTVTLQLRVEQYNSFPISGSNLSELYPLEVSWNTVELASRSIILGHTINTTSQGGVYSTITHDYIPFISIEDAAELTMGDPFQDVLSSYPLGSSFTTAEWLTFSFEDPDGNVESFTREIKDVIGLDARLNGGSLNIAPPADNSALIKPGESFVMWLLPNLVRDEGLLRQEQTSLVASMIESAAATVQIGELSGISSLTAEEQAALNEAQLTYYLNQAQSHAATGLDYAARADVTANDIERSMRVKLYPNRPRIIIFSTRFDEAENRLVTVLDLRTTYLETIVYPGQATAAAFSANWFKGVADSYQEGDSLERATGEQALTTALVFDAMSEQGIAPVFITSDNQDLLDVYNLDPASYAYVVEALRDGKQILIPTDPVQLNGEPVLAWWEIDPQTGETIGVMDGGLHASALQYEIIAAILDSYYLAGSLKSLHDGVDALYDYIVCNVVGALGGGGGECGDLENPIPMPSPLPPAPWGFFGRSSSRSSTISRVFNEGIAWRYLPAHLCPVENCGLEQFIIDTGERALVPLPDMAFAYHDRFAAHLSDGRTFTVTNNGAGGSPAITLTTTPETSTVLPYRSATFDIDVAANFSDTVDVIVQAPKGWFAAFTGETTVQVAAPPGAPAAQYALWLIGQADHDPNVLATAQHTVTVPVENGLDMRVVEEADITIPMGEAEVEGVSNQTNDGEAEIPGAAHAVALYNASSVTKTIDVTVSGAPADWVILDGARQADTSVTLAPGWRTALGLYVSPPSDTLPAAGMSFVIDISADDGGALSASDQVTFTMPSQPFNFLMIEPATLYVTPTDSITFTVTMDNVGNASGSFPLTATVPISSWTVSPLQTPVALAASETHAQIATLDVVSATLGQRYPLQLETAAMDRYTQYAFADVQIVSADSATVLRAAEATATACPVAEPGLSAALETLALTMVELERWCDIGDCPLPLRDGVVDAASGVAYYADVSPLIPGDDTLAALAATLSTRTDDADILSDLAAISDAVEVIEREICELSQHLPAVEWTPYYNAALQGETVTYTLDVVNHGTVTTTYAITADLPPGQQTFSVTLAPGATDSRELPFSGAALGFYDLEAVALATGPDVQLDDLTASDSTHLSVVDRYVQVTAVDFDPPFVETGSSSTTLSVDVTNVANLLRPVDARTTILEPGGAVRWTDDIPLTLLAGSPRTYALAVVDTSSWVAGVYTVTVDLLDRAGALIPYGTGYSYLSVGQAMAASHAVTPTVVAPGTISVTTVITTEILTDTIQPLDAAPLLQGDRSAGDATAKRSPAQMEGLEPETSAVVSFYDDLSLDPVPATRAPLAPNTVLTITGGYTRTEEDEASIATSGAWFNASNARASSGSYRYASDAGASASFTFSGTWVSLGLIGASNAGRAEVFIDGSSQGTLDLYRRALTPLTFVYNDLDSATHTISVTVLGTSNPFASDTRVQLDYVDVWDGTALPDGTFEQGSDRVFRSSGWSTYSNSKASGGYYMRSNAATAWFPFTGQSFTYHAIALSGGGEAKLLVDGQYLTTVDLSHWPTVTRTFAFTGFTTGAHVVQVSTYRAWGTVDAFTTPGSAPFVDLDPPPTSFTRYEEDDPALRYNGAPYTQTATTWSMLSRNRASQGYVARSATGGDTVSFQFTGAWVGLGFFADLYSGQAEVFIDGTSQGVIDLYRRDRTSLAFYYDDFITGTHTISFTVLGAAHPYAENERVHFDYIDVWDGTALPDGTFEETDDRVMRNSTWSVYAREEASGGYYAYDGKVAWFPFTGDSISYQAIVRDNASHVRVSIDGELVDLLNLYNTSITTRTFSFDDLGPGGHIFQLETYRGVATLDSLTTPGSAPYHEPSVHTGIVRHEEDDPDLRYNGVPFTERPGSWSAYAQNDLSGGYRVGSATLSDTVSLSFYGSWVSVGFGTRDDTGLAEVFIDGTSVGVVDTYTTTDSPLEVIYDGLTTATHTITVTVLDDRNPASTGDLVILDYIDVWDGTSMPDGWVDAAYGVENGRVHFSASLSNADAEVAHGGSFAYGTSSATSAWFLFTGDAFTYLGRSVTDGAETEVFIDGVSQGILDLTTDYTTEQPVAFHYDGLPDSPHVVRVSAASKGRYDAFKANPAAFTSYVPEIEWYDTAPATPIGTFSDLGMLSTIAVGDLEGDGIVELVAPSNNGTLYVYRGDGLDAGGGTPLRWSTVISPSAEPALADLDGDGDAEIVTVGYGGVHALHHDGSLYWFTDTVKSYFSDSGGTYGWGGPSIANLDFDPEPEIVIAAYDQSLVVFEPDGTIAFSEPIGRRPTVPTLADVTDDGMLDIIVVQDDTLTVYDYYNGGTIALTHTITSSTQQQSWGAPAVADVDGQQPGGDAGPEIVVAWRNYIQVVDDDGSLVWSYATDLNTYFPSHVAIADTDGDEEVEIIAVQAVNPGIGNPSKHVLYVLNADGTLLWQRDVIDRTGSSSGVAVHDLNGDGAWEVLWNGSVQGFTIFDGSDGAILFNEAFINSGTLLDYPVIADVDDDGHAEVVVGDRDGIYVVGHDGVWAPARPMWNSHDYHITNVNDDWSVPANEPPSWEVHNTYRTQTPLSNPAPVYGVDLTQTVGISGVVVLTSTFSAPAEEADPVYHWAYGQQWYERVHTTTFDSLLTAMQPGEVRQVAAFTEVRYELESGVNRLLLPPLYVSAPHIVKISPFSQTVAAGGAGVYDVVLDNPNLAVSDTYTLSVEGSPTAWAAYPPTVTFQAGETQTVTLTLSVPAEAGLGAYPIAVNVTNGLGGADRIVAELLVSDGLDMELAPQEQSAVSGRPVTYSLSLSNQEPVTRTYLLTATGLADVTLPSTVTVTGNGLGTVVVTATAPTAGPHPFSIVASAVGSGGEDSDDEVLTGVGTRGVTAGLSPDTGVGGPGSSVVYTVTVTNMGSLSDTYDLDLDLPAGWVYRLAQNGTDVSRISLQPTVFASAELKLTVIPALGTAPGTYPFTLTVQSASDPAVSGRVAGELEVLSYGVQVRVSPPSTTLTPDETGIWQVVVTNTGSIADTFVLTNSGILAGSAGFSQNPISLAAGEAQAVQLTAGPVPFALPQVYLHEVMVESTAVSRIRDADLFEVSFGDYESVSVAWSPPDLVVTNTLTGSLMMVVSNTGNLFTEYQVAFSAPELSGELAIDGLTILPHAAAGILTTVEAPGPGVYTFSATAESAGGNVSASQVATLTVVGSSNAPPSISNIPDQATKVGVPVGPIDFTVNDADGVDELTLSARTSDSGLVPISGIHFGGSGASRTVIITPTEGISGTATVTVTVSDGVDSDDDAFVLLVEPYVIYIPLIMRDQGRR